MRIEQLCREVELNLRWTVFPLHPDTPEDGLALEDLFPGKDIPGMLAMLRERAAELDLPFGERSHTYNSRRAQELGKWAEEQGRGAAFRDAVYRAYFAEGKNIARLEVLLAICDSLELATARAGEILERGEYAAAVDADWQRAMQLGVRSVPSHLYANRLLVGFRDYSDFRRLVAQ